MKIYWWSILHDVPSLKVTQKKQSLGENHKKKNINIMGEKDYATT